MTKFIIMTPCSRTENIYILYEDLLQYTPTYNIEWYIVYDSLKDNKDKRLLGIDWIHQYSCLSPNSKWGYFQRNFVLDVCGSGYIYCLDDDTIMHPDFFSTLFYYINYTNSCSKRGFLFHVEMENGDILYARPNNIKAFGVGMQSYCLHKSLIGDRRYQLYQCSDGGFIEDLYKARKDEFEIIPEILAYHNYLRRN